jgi:polar amino acid transport system substrate-binding protein
MMRICIALALIALALPASAQIQKGSTVSTVSPDVLKDLAPTGTLRASINLGNIVLAQGTPDNPSGVTPELARATIESVEVLGAFHASARVREALRDRIR